MKKLLVVMLLFSSGCTALGVDPKDVDEVVGITPDESGSVCVKGSIVKNGISVEYKKIEVSKDTKLQDVSPEQMQEICPK